MLDGEHRTSMSDIGIAQRLYLSTFTVKSRDRDVLEKMALHSRLEIAANSYEHNGSSELTCLS
jgi:DNA-binding NarL/FixJ family response regulator